MRLWPQKEPLPACFTRSPLLCCSYILLNGRSPCSAWTLLVPAHSKPCCPFSLHFHLKLKFLTSAGDNTACFIPGAPGLVVPWVTSSEHLLWAICAYRACPLGLDLPLPGPTSVSQAQTSPFSALPHVFSDMVLTACWPLLAGPPLVLSPVASEAACSPVCRLYSRQVPKCPQRMKI